MTLREISERIAYALGDPLNFVLKENIKFSFSGWRALLIRRDSAANGISDEFLQRAYFNLIKVDKVDNCNFDVNCTILRTTNKIPKPIRMKNDVLFKTVGTVDGSKVFAYSEYEEVKYRCGNKFTGSQPLYSYINDYGYFFNVEKLKRVMFQYVPVNPLEIKDCDTGACMTDDDEYPFAADMLPDVIRGILSGEFKVVNSESEAVNIEDKAN